MSCDFTDLDGAYVLGSLAPAERQEYERHLAGCEVCARSVRELAGLPGLLARVPASVLEEPAGEEEVPTTLLPSLVAAARRDQRRRTARAALVAAAAVAVLAGGSAAVGAALGDDGDRDAAPAASPSTAPAQRLSPVGSTSSTGWISLTSVDWGTRLDLTCAYDAPSAGYGYDVPTYTMVVRTTDGREEQVATWQALPGRELHVTGATAASPDDIASVEVRTSGGQPVLRLEP